MGIIWCKFIRACPRLRIMVKAGSGQCGLRVHSGFLRRKEAASKEPSPSCPSGDAGHLASRKGVDVSSLYRHLAWEMVLKRKGDKGPI